VPCFARSTGFGLRQRVLRTFRANTVVTRSYCCSLMVHGKSGRYVWSRHSILLFSLMLGCLPSTAEIKMSGIGWSNVGSLRGPSRRCEIEACVGANGVMARFIPEGFAAIEISGLFPDLEAAREAASSGARAFFKRQVGRK